MAKKYLAPVSYEKLTGEGKSFYLWQNRKVILILDQKEDVSFDDYKSNVVLVGKSLLDKKIQDNNEDQKETLLLYDYVTYKFSRNGEHIFHVMPILASDLLEKAKDEEVRIEDWVLPYPICYFKIPLGMMFYNFSEKKIDVEGVYVEEVFDGKDTKLSNRIGFRLIAVDYEGNPLITLNLNLNKKDDGSLIPDKICGSNDIELLNDLHRFLDVVLKYIYSLSEKEDNLEEFFGDDDDDINEKEKNSKTKKKKDKKKKEDLTDKEREMLGIKVVVLDEKSRRRSGTRRSGPRVTGGQRVCCNVRGYWRYMGSDKYKNLQGQKSWVRSHLRGLAASYRVGTIYQVGKE